MVTVTAFRDVALDLASESSRMDAMLRALPKPFVVAAILSLVMLVGFQSAWAFACRVDGKTRSTCCCRAEQRERDRAPDSAPRIAARGCCCEVSFHDRADAPVAREADRVAFAPASFAVPAEPIAIVDPRIERVLSFSSLARPPPPRLALYLHKHSLLR